MASTTLAQVRSAHELVCGVVQEDAEYSTEEDHASRGAFDPALCAAVATAADAQAAVRVVSFLDEVSATDALRAGKVDVIATLSADAAHPAPRGVALARPILFDGLGLLVPVAGGVHHAGELAGRKICVLAETGAETGLRAWFAAEHLDLLPFPFQEEGEMEAAYVTGNCAAMAAQRTRLSLLRLSLGAAGKEHAVLPEVLAPGPMAMATRSEDAGWAKIVAAVSGLLVQAEAAGVTAATASDPRALAREGDVGERLGLRAGWAGDVLRRTGNYAELYARTLGGPERDLARGPNRLVREGGLLGP